MVQQHIKRNRDPRYQAPVPPEWPSIVVMFAVMFFAVLILSGCSAYAQEVQLACGPIELVLDTLEHQFGETLHSQQVIDGNTFELWANHDTGTWTILTYPNGDSVCIVDEGVRIIPGVAI